MFIEKSFERDKKKLIEFIREIKPEVTDYEEKAINSLCKSMVVNCIHEIGNSINSLTNNI